MEDWRRVWREGIVPILSTPGLQALCEALFRDDPRLIQGATTNPPPLRCVQDWPVEAACALGYCVWQGDGLETVGDIEQRFALDCELADSLLKEPAGVRWFLGWFDDTPRDQMREQLLGEVKLALNARMEVAV